MTRPILAAAESVQTGVFSGLSTSHQLEDRIAAFAEDLKRGAAFEVFAEAYLVTQPQHDAIKVWPFRAIPIELLQRLSLLTQDYGMMACLRQVSATTTRTVVIPSSFSKFWEYLRIVSEGKTVRQLFFKSYFLSITGGRKCSTLLVPANYVRPRATRPVLYLLVPLMSSSGPPPRK